MFFYSSDVRTASKDYKNLVALAVKSAPPCKAKVHLAKYNAESFVTALIYPAEYDSEVSTWLIDGEYKTAGPAEGGIQAVQSYYSSKVEILERHQLFGLSQYQSRTGTELLAGLKTAVQR